MLSLCKAVLLLPKILSRFTNRYSRLPQWQMRSCNFKMDPHTVPRTTARMTGGIFFISVTEMIPITMEQIPKTLFSASVSKRNFRFNMLPNKPPKTTDITSNEIPSTVFTYSISVFCFSLAPARRRAAISDITICRFSRRRTPSF